MAVLQVFGGNLDDLDRLADGGSAMAQGFVKRFVGVLQLGVFAHDADLDGAFRMYDGLDHRLPGVEVGGRES